MDTLSRIVRGIAACALVLCAAAPAFARCEAPDLTEPAGRVVADPRPRIAWTAVQGADSYAVSVQSRVAEGRLIASYDVSLASHEFIPPAALTDEKATVTVTIAARCAGVAGAARSASFRIDATRTCPTPQQLTIAADGGKLRAVWQAVPGAMQYEVKTHAAADGSATSAVEVREARAELTVAASPGTVVSVRPRCAAAYGEPAFAVLMPQ
jgi:hypothetical protein